MLKTIYKSVADYYHLETEHDIIKTIGLHVFTILGLVSGLFLFIRDLFSYSPDQCLPGDVSLLIVFGFALFALLNNQRKWAIRIFFLVPIIPYFFFISDSHAIFPNHSSLTNTLCFLSPFFLFFLIYSDKKSDLSLFYLLSLLTILLHTYLAGATDQLLRWNWQTDTNFINPVVVLSIFYIISLIIAWNYQTRIDRLTEEREQTEQSISQTIRNFPMGILLLETVRDEFDTPSHLVVKRTNLAFERLFKISSREIKDQKADVVLPKVFRDSFDWNNQIHNNRKNKLSIYLDRLDRYFDMTSMPINEKQVACFFTDVSVQQKQIINLEENKRRYQVLLEAVPDLFFIIDKDGIYVDFVFKATESIKIKPEDIIGNSIFEVGFSEKMSAAIYKCINNCIETDSIETIEYALEIEGATAMFEMRIARLNNNSVISLARDITQRKMAEIMLEQAKEKAEEADRLKTAFLANISHEIRTPMNAIIGFSKMIGSSDFDEEEKKKFLEIIITNGKVLLTLINDMISLSKIESNTLVTKPLPCKLNDLMVSLYKDFNYDLEERKNIILKLRCENTNPKFMVTTDSSLLTAILSKLIDNGIKFTEFGEVEFGYRLTNLEQIEFFVTDTGIGIAERDQERIFERFHQLDNRTIRAYEGTGLGLSIAQHYVRLLGGSLRVKSRLGKGSTFTFTIPFIQEQTQLKIVR